MNTGSSRAILVTGASSGIGNHLSRALAAAGHRVFATARKERDLAALAAIENVVPLRLDVRDAQQVRDAAETVTRSAGGLYGLVNNAGSGQLGPCSAWTDEELLDIFDVNVFGPFRMTNAFVRMLVESKGRVVNIGSQGGMISKKYYGPYTMTKHALEAYTVALSDELTPYGVRVSIVQPGGIASAMGENSMPGMLARFERVEPPFREEAQAVIEALNHPYEAPHADVEESETNRKPSSPEIVTRAVMDALFSDQPKLRYMVGTRWEGDRVLHALVEKLLDENDSPSHNYTETELIALLTRKIAERRG